MRRRAILGGGWMAEPERMRKSSKNRSLRVIHGRLENLPIIPKHGTLIGVENGAGAPGERWRRDVMVEMERRGWCGGVG